MTMKGETPLVYVGTYTNAGSEGIYICQLDMTTGGLKQRGVARHMDNPSYLAIDTKRNRLYAVNELLAFNGQPGGAVSAFAIQPSSGELSLISQQASNGGSPCYLSIDHTGRYLLVANYSGGNVTVIPIGKNGVLGKATDIVLHSGSSQHPKRQNSPHPHSIVLDPANKYVFVPDLGLDKVMAYRFDPDNGRLLANRPAWIKTAPGAGPRHMIFHPKNKAAYVINELDSTITTYEYHHAEGELAIAQTISTIPESYLGDNIASDLHLTPDGRFLYGSNRGHDSIVIYSVDHKTGWLSRIENAPTRGTWPRSFAVDPSGTFLLVANQNSHTIVTFWIDPERGTLTPTGQEIELPSPVCLKFASLAIS